MSGELRILEAQGEAAINAWCSSGRIHERDDPNRIQKGMRNGSGGVAGLDVPNIEGQAHVAKTHVFATSGY